MSEHSPKDTKGADLGPPPTTSHRKGSNKPQGSADPTNPFGTSGHIPSTPQTSTGRRTSQPDTPPQPKPLHPKGGCSNTKSNRRRGSGVIPKLSQNRSLGTITEDIRKDTQKGRLSISRPLIMTGHKRSVRPSLLTPALLADITHSLSLSLGESGSQKHLPVKIDPETRRDTVAKITFSLSQQSNILRLEKSLTNLPEGMRCRGVHHRKRLHSMHEWKTMAEEGDETLGFTMDREFKDFQRDFYRRLEEAAIKRKSLRISISPDVTETLTSNPPDRTLLQLEENQSSTPGVCYRGSRPSPPLMKSHISPCSKDRHVDPVPPRRLPQSLAFNRPDGSYKKFRCFRNTLLMSRNRSCDERFILPYMKEHVFDEERGKMVAKAAAFIKTGDTFGSYSLIHGVERQASVISRTNMQLLAIHGDDYLDLIFRRALSDELPPHIQYLSTCRSTVSNAFL
ncbi:hypothetical protein ACOMHN_046219 [Nucella lapillus]